MKTLLIIFLLITTVGYSQTDTLTFKAGTYEAGVYVRDANNVVWQTLKKATVTAAPKAGTIWKRITPIVVPPTVQELQAQITTLKAMVDNMAFTLYELRNNAVPQSAIQDLISKLDTLNKKIDDTTLEIEVDDEGIPLATVLGQKVTLKSLSSGKKTKLGDNSNNVKIEQQ